MDIGVVLVTYNRLEELKETVGLYETQTKMPRYILIVDNHSTDGTEGFLAQWQKEQKDVPRYVLRLTKNEGGSGGFHEGMKRALEMDADWIWLADDDAYPEKNALEVLERFSCEHRDLMKNVAALCTKNYGDNGITFGHRCRFVSALIGKSQVPVSQREYEKDYFFLDMYSFVGTLISKRVLQEAGLPVKGFFIYADDTEHSLRVGKYGKIVCVPKAKVYHNDNNNYTSAASWRDYYATRNILLTYKWHLDKTTYYKRRLFRQMTALRSMNSEKMKVFRAAILDAKNDVLGLHPVYRPGWHPKEK